jgi:hypothetical protein
MDKYAALLNLIFHVPIVGEQPLSALFIGHPGSGKSYTLKQYTASNCIEINDVTAAGIETILDKFDKDHTLSYIVIPDLLKPMSRRPKPFLTFLNIGLEEGFRNIIRKDFGWETKNGGAKFGVLGALTIDSFRSNHRLMRQTGFLSRSLVVNYLPDIDSTADQIAMGMKVPPIESQIPDRTEVPTIHVTQPIADMFKKAAYRWAEQDEEIPFRKITILRRLCKAYALVTALDAESKAKDITVTESDVRTVVKLVQSVAYKKKDLMDYRSPKREMEQ